MHGCNFPDIGYNININCAGITQLDDRIDVAE
jgi:hypothetical protein